MTGSKKITAAGVILAVLIAVTVFFISCTSEDRKDGTSIEAVDRTAETPAAGIENEEVPPALGSQFETDFTRRSISFDDILSGGPPKDGIPAVDNPRFISLGDADAWISGREPVITVVYEDTAKLYPLQILTYHEIVNDTVAGLSVAVTFCPLCNTGIVFHRDVPLPDGPADTRLLDFGTTGRLRFSNLLMYDRQTESWWQQATGEAVIGAYTGTRLDMVPATTLSWREAKENYPEALVLSRDTGFQRPYGTNPYAGYDTASPWAYRGPEPPDERDLMDRVLTVSVGGESELYAYTQLREERFIRDELGGRQIVVFWHPGTASVLDSSAIAEGRDVGTANAFSAAADVPGEGETVLSFFVRDSAVFDRNTGSEWNAAGKAVSGPLRGSGLDPVPATDHFWFSAWAFSQPAGPGGEITPPES